MELDLSQFGFGDSIEPETMIIVMIAVLGLACLGPLLAMGGRNHADQDEGGHPLRTKLGSAERDRSERNIKKSKIRIKSNT